MINQEYKQMSDHDKGIARDIEAVHSYMEDVNNSSQTPDISRRFLPSLTVGLSYYMSMKRPGIDAGRITFLKQEYEERLANALHEDRERASAYFLPRIRVW